jgi:TRAP transporter TAXI family solute receptor
MFLLRALTISFMISIGMGNGLQAKEADAQREMVNKATVTVLGGSLSGTYSRLVSDMAAAFNDGYDFRIVPVVGQGSIKGVEDLLFLDGVDIAILQSDVLDFFSARSVYPDLRQNLRYITVLFNEEIHLVARDDIESVGDLVGKRVSFGPAASGAFLTSSVIFNQLGLDVEVFELSNQEGLERLKRGEIEALVRVVGAPNGPLQNVTKADGLHIIPLPALGGAYFPATLTHQQYPNLIPAGETVQTAAVGALMAAYDWPEGHPKRIKIQSVVDRLYARLDELQIDPHHVKWRQVDLERKLPGWIRWATSPGPRS